MSNDERSLAKFLRLYSGDDVISEVVEIDDDQGIRYTLYHPFKVVYVPIEESGYLSINFMPWVFPRLCDKQEFTIDASDIMLIEDVSTKMNTYYWESVDSHNNTSSEKKEEREQIDHQAETENALDEKTLLDIINQMRYKRTYH